VEQPFTLSCRIPRQGTQLTRTKVEFCCGNVLVISAVKILIAEDDKDSRDLLSWLLQKLGYQVVATENGKEAWEAYRRGRFRLVISDLLMPDTDGLELVRRIRAQKQAKYTYIILITALIGKKDYLEGMEAGADDFVTKPFDPDELKARLRVAERIISFQEHAATIDEAAHKTPGLA
jgi:DNA-binding response OmpR family regulator